MEAVGCSLQFRCVRTLLNMYKISLVISCYFLLHLNKFSNGETMPFLSMEEYRRFRGLLKAETVKTYPSDGDDTADVVIQDVDDKLNLTFYKFGDTGKPVFLSVGLTNVGEDVVVLLRGDDYIDPFNKKKFVILRKRGSGNEYNVHLAQIWYDIDDQPNVSLENAVVSLQPGVNRLIAYLYEGLLFGSSQQSIRPRCTWFATNLLCDNGEKIKLGEFASLFPAHVSSSGSGGSSEELVGGGGGFGGGGAFGSGEGGITGDNGGGTKGGNVGGNGGGSFGQGGNGGGTSGGGSFGTGGSGGITGDNGGGTKGGSVGGNVGGSFGQGGSGGITGDNGGGTKGGSVGGNGGGSFGKEGTSGSGGGAGGGSSTGGGGAAGSSTGGGAGGNSGGAGGSSGGGGGADDAEFFIKLKGKGGPGAISQKKS